MATIKRFEDLEIWQEARGLSIEIISIATNTNLKTYYRSNMVIFRFCDG